MACIDRICFIVSGISRTLTATVRRTIDSP